MSENVMPNPSQEKSTEKKEVLVSMKHVQIGFKRGTKLRVVIDDLNLDIKVKFSVLLENRDREKLL